MCEWKWDINDFQMFALNIWRYCYGGLMYQEAGVIYVLIFREMSSDGCFGSRWVLIKTVLRYLWWLAHKMNHFHFGRFANPERQLCP